MNSMVISIGGSVLLSSDATDEYLKSFVSLCLQMSTNSKLYLVVGGGKPAREYIRKGRNLNLTESDLDDLGIMITRVNATFLSKLFQTANKTIPISCDEAAALSNDIIIMGGTTPGHSTDYVGAELAEAVHADKYIIATNVDGVFDKDPNKFPNAVRIPEISIKDLLGQYGESWDAAGSNVVIDGPALKKIDHARIPTMVVNGKKLSELEKAMLDKSFLGTKIHID